MVGAIGRKVKPPIRREDDTTCTFKGVRRAVLTTDRLERPRSRTTSGATFHFRKRAARSAMIMYDAVLDLVRLHVEVSAIRRARLLGPHLFRYSHLSCLLRLDYLVLAEAPARSSQSPWPLWKPLLQHGHERSRSTYGTRRSFFKALPSSAATDHLP